MHLLSPAMRRVCDYLQEGANVPNVGLGHLRDALLHKTGVDPRARTLEAGLTGAFSCPPEQAQQGAAGLRVLCVLFSARVGEGSLSWRGPRLGKKGLVALSPPRSTRVDLFFFALGLGISDALPLDIVPWR